MTTRTTRRWVLERLLAGVAAGAVLPASPTRANALRVGSAAPPATLVTLDGQRISTPDLIGSVVVLTFWATWCVPCRDELPLLSDYAAANAAHGLRVLGFCLDEPDQLPAVRAMAASLSFPVGLLSAGSAPGYGRIWRLPVNFTIDRAGLLVENGWKLKNPVWTRARLEETLTPLLGASAGDR